MCTYMHVKDPELLLHRRGVGSSGELAGLCSVWVSQGGKYGLRAWRGVQLSEMLEKGMSSLSYRHVP